VVKVRDGLAAGDYRDPGPYQHPAGTVAYEYAGEPGAAPRPPEIPAAEKSSSRTPAMDIKVIKPGTRHTPESSH